MMAGLMRPNFSKPNPGRNRPYTGGCEQARTRKQFDPPLEVLKLAEAYSTDNARSLQVSGHPLGAGTRILRGWPATRKLKAEPWLGACLSYRGNAGEVTANRITTTLRPALGAEIINDPSALTFDAQLGHVAAQHDAGLILNHMRGTPETWAKLGPLPDVMGAVVHDLEATVSRARRAGVDHARIILDPGLGFGKRKEQNSQIIARLQQLAKLDCPILAGPSRKSFLVQGTEKGTAFATASAVAACILSGAHMVRVHDVREMKVVASVADAVLNGAAE
jgi:hypothetical protein